MKDHRTWWRKGYEVRCNLIKLKNQLYDYPLFSAIDEPSLYGSNADMDECDCAWEQVWAESIGLL